jgi:hypothetical protein
MTQESVLGIFLLGTLDSNSSLRKLRGKSDILMLIWTRVCEEWWSVNIDFYGTTSIPSLLPKFEPRYTSYPQIRRQLSGCPIATVAKDLSFPPPAVVPLGTFKDQQSEHLFINMMPIDLLDLESIPTCCRGYISFISLVTSYISTRTRSPKLIAYLSIDERPLSAGMPQRRAGLHVESPGFLPLLSTSYISSGRFVPGAEHHWGHGLMTRDERIEGGIFMASNVSGTCAVWNCSVRNSDGSIVGPHGGIERLRPLIGPPSLLEAGKVHWSYLSPSITPLMRQGRWCG